MGDRGSYLTNKLNSLRGNRSPSPIMNTVSSNMTIGRGYETIQPSFANRDLGNTYQPITIRSDSLRRTPPTRIVSGSPPRAAIPLDTTPYYSVPQTSYEPLRASPPRYIAPVQNPITSTSYQTRATPPSVLRTAPTPSYEIKASPHIYQLTGTSDPLGSYKPSAAPIGTYTPFPVSSFQQDDLRRLLRPQDDQDIRNRLKSDLYNLSETLTANDISSLQDSIRSLRDRLPQERANTEMLEKNLVQYLIEEDSKRAALAQKILQKEGEYRIVAEQHSALDRQLRDVQAERQRVADENKRLIDELKGLGRNANEVISELDAKLNGIKRMREHEKSNFVFECENIKGEYQYILSEMESDFKAKTARTEAELSQINAKKEDEKAQIREIQTKVQQLLASSDARVKQLIENIKDEGEKQLNYERRQLESRTQGVEDATRNQKDKNDDFVRKIEDFERVTNGKINDQRNKIYHLKDVLARERLEDRKGQEALKELGRVQGDLNKERSALEIDYNNLLKKRDALDQAKRLELENNKAIVVSEEKKFQEAVNMHRKREQELEDKISRVRSDHAALMAKHRDTAAKLQGGLHNTLAETIGRYNEPYPY